MIARVYIDTSVIGGCRDEEFRNHSERLLADFEADRLRPVISNITIAEVLQAPEQVRTLLGRPGLEKAEKVYLNEEAALLRGLCSRRSCGRGQPCGRTAYSHCNR